MAFDPLGALQGPFRIEAMPRKRRKPQIEARPMKCREFCLWLKGYLEMHFAVYECETPEGETITACEQEMDEHISAIHGVLMKVDATELGPAEPSLDEI
jgi:hypothetical protein